MFDREPTRVCSKCGIEKPLSEYYADKGCRDGRRKDCKACFKSRAAARYAADPRPARERARRWMEENRDRYNARMAEYRASGKKAIADRKSYLKRTFGITPEEYDELLASQGGGCAICGRPPRDDSSLHIDHCHITGTMRAILCFDCNSLLGKAGDDPDLLIRAAEYLVDHEVALARQRALALRPTA